MNSANDASQAILQNAQDALDSAINQVQSLPAAIAAIFAEAHSRTDDLVATTVSGLADAHQAIAEAIEEMHRIVIEADASGKTEVTGVIQKYVDLAASADQGKPFRLLLGPGTYLVDAVTGINLRANLDFKLDPDAKLVVKKNDSYRYNIFLANQTVIGTKLYGGKLVGDRDEHIYQIYPPKPQKQADGSTIMVANAWDTHEQGHGVRVRGAKNFTVANMEFYGFTGDAISVGGSEARDNAPSRGITIESIFATECRRQGLSIGNVYGCIVRNSLITRIGLDNGISKGTSPKCGVDMEPNDPGETAPYETRSCSDVLFDNVTISGCQSFGFNIRMRVDKVRLLNCHIVENNSRGFMNTGGTNIDIEAGEIGRNGQIGAAYAAGTTGSVQRVRFDRNVFPKHQAQRVLPLVTSGTPTGVSNDLVINEKATVAVGENYFL